jgi:hypothetical protein
MVPAAISPMHLGRVEGSCKVKFLLSCFVPAGREKLGHHKLFVLVEKEGA